MAIKYNVRQDCSLEITDISGKLVGKYNLNALESVLEVKNEKMENGLYLYRVTSIGGNLVKVGKIIIAK